MSTSLALASHIPITVTVNNPDSDSKWLEIANTPRTNTNTAKAEDIQVASGDG